MTELLTNLWMNLDNFNYMKKEIVKVSDNDVEMLRKSRRNAILKPTVCLMLTLMFSRYRGKLWNKLRETLLGDRLVLNQLKKEEEMKLNVINAEMKNHQKPAEIKIEYKQNSYSVDEENKIAISKSRRLYSRRKKNQEEIENTTNTVKLTRTEPTVSEEYLHFLPRYKKNVMKISAYKKFFQKYTGKEDVYNKGEKFILNSRLIYLPFLFVLFISIYDLGLTYIALYFKYQPLVDEYYSQKYLNKNL
jgi:hypothetical protein